MVAVPRDDAAHAFFAAQRGYEEDAVWRARSQRAEPLPRSSCHRLCAPLLFTAGLRGSMARDQRPLLSSPLSVRPAQVR